jgi:phenylpropionate dioxygenase-like ring-hydroxylating dioxygenase large terminal subunit
MLSREDNEALTQVDPGTLMGEFMRRHWIPACLSSELVADGAPVRLLLLGERLLGFRDSSGRIGIMEHRCPHRCSSLFFGRNEEGGLRCVYHGWKFDVDGNCIDMPNVPAEQDFKRKVKNRAYPAVERAGLVWTYMGPDPTSTKIPEIEALMLPDDERVINLHQRECNWLQSVEGDIDTSHFGFLHIGSLDADEVDSNSMHKWGVVDRAPDYFVSETDWGTMYAAYRDAEPGSRYYRFAHFLMPFFTFSPNGTFEDFVACTINVPMDDTHTMVYNIGWSKKTPPLLRTADGELIPGFASDAKYLPRTDDWYGRWRLEAGRSNDYFIDREAQRTFSYTGITGIRRQDQAAVESMGDISDRTLEHLAPSDRMITMTRRRLLKAIRDLSTTQQLPTTVRDPAIYRGARGGSFVAPSTLDWKEAYAQRLGTAVSPLGMLRVASQPS